MEDLILSQDMPVFSNKPDGLFHQDMAFEGVETDELHLDGYQRSDVCSMNQQVIGAFPSCAHSSGDECNLRGMLFANPWLSPDMSSTTALTAVSTASAASLFHSNIEEHMRDSTEFGGREGVAHVVRKDSEVVAEPAETLLASAGFHGAEGGYDIAAEDWLDIISALDAVAESGPISMA